MYNVFQTINFFWERRWIQCDNPVFSIHITLTGPDKLNWNAVSKRYGQTIIKEHRNMLIGQYVFFL